MAGQEYYIREASETEARGPFNMEQLISLGETGGLTAETLWYDASVEDWAPIGSNENLKGTIFPEKRKLRMKVREMVSTPKQSDTAPPITVEDMLAGAEGKTAETKDKKDPAIMQAHAARIGMWSAVVCLVLAAAGEILPAADAISAGDLNKVMQQPFAFLGAIDLFIAVMIGLGVVSFYPFVRFRAAFGLGLIGIMNYALGLKAPLIAEVVGAAGLYLVTLWIDMMPVLLAAAAGLLGGAATAYFFLAT